MMPYSDKAGYPISVKSLPEKAQLIWAQAFNSAWKAGNIEKSCQKIAWAAVNNFFKHDKNGAWVEKKASEANLPFSRFLEQAIQIKFSDKTHQPGDVVKLQFCFVGPLFSSADLDNVISNFHKNSYGQAIPLVVGHPFLTKSPNPDRRAYGILEDVYREGTHEGWIAVKLNKLGADALNNQEYLYLSPGWFPDWEHTLTGERVGATLMEVSLTNIPAEKMMKSILAAAMKSIDEEKPEDSISPEEIMKDFSLNIEKIRAMLKNKRSSPAIRAKLADLLKDLSGQLKTNEQEGAEDMDIKTLEAELKAMKDRVTVLEDSNKKKDETLKTREAKLKTSEETIKTMEGEKKAAAVAKYLESLVPAKIKKDDRDKFQAFALKLNDADMEEFKTLMTCMTGPGEKAGKFLETKGTPADAKKAKKAESGEKTKISETDFFIKVREAAALNPESMTGKITAFQALELAEVEIGKKFESTKEVESE